VTQPTVASSSIERTSFYTFGNRRGFFSL